MEGVTAQVEFKMNEEVMEVMNSSKYLENCFSKDEGLQEDEN